MFKSSFRVPISNWSREEYRYAYCWQGPGCMYRSLPFCACRSTKRPRQMHLPWHSEHHSSPTSVLAMYSLVGRSCTCILPSRIVAKRQIGTPLKGRLEPTPVYNMLVPIPFNHLAFSTHYTLCILDSLTYWFCLSSLLFTAFSNLWISNFVCYVSISS